MTRVKEIQDKQNAPKLDKAASKRFVRSALWQMAHKKAKEGAPSTSTGNPSDQSVIIHNPYNDQWFCGDECHKCDFKFECLHSDTKQNVFTCAGCHSDWKNGRVFPSQGKVREFYPKCWKNQKKLYRKILEKSGKFCQPEIVKTLQI